MNDTMDGAEALSSLCNHVQHLLIVGYVSGGDKHLCSRLFKRLQFLYLTAYLILGLVCGQPLSPIIPLRESLTPNQNQSGMDLLRQVRSQLKANTSQTA